MSELKDQTVSGVKHLVGSGILRKIITFGSTVILARILGPAEFGLFALAFVAINAFGVFKNMGFDSALIQRKNDIEKAANTAFFVIPVSGVLLYLILFISAPFVAEFLNNKELIGVIRALGFIFVLSCLGKVPAALLENKMEFRRVFIIETSAAIVYSVSAILFAILKFGVWSLVIAYIIKTFFHNILAFIYSGWRPQFQFDRKIALEMFHFGKYLFLGGIIWFLKMNLDNLLVGKLLGVISLGLYAIAFNIANVTADYFGVQINRVVFPAYSKLQDNLEDLGLAVLKVLRYVSLVALPFGVCVFFFSKDILNFIYGPQWLDASRVLCVLAWAGIFNTLYMANGGVFAACGRTKISLLLISLQVLLFFIFVIPAVKLYGLFGVGLVVSLVSFVNFTISLIGVMKIVPVSLKQIYSSVRMSLLASFFMAAVIIFFKNTTILSGLRSFNNYNFFISFFTGVCSYILCIVIMEKSIVREITGLLFERKMLTED